MKHSANILLYWSTPSLMQIGFLLAIFFIKSSFERIPHLMTWLFDKQVWFNSGASIPENLILSLLICIVSPSIIFTSDASIKKIVEKKL